jgi:hypothetical protein
MSNQSLISDLIQFIKDPSKYLSHNTLRVSDKFNLVFNLTSLTIFMVFTLGFLSNFIIDLVGYSQDQNNIVLESLSEIPAWVSLVLVTIVGPMTEELAFRFFLRANKAVFLLGGLFYFCFISNTLVNYLRVSDENFYSIVLVLSGLLVFLVSYFVLPTEKIKTFVTKHFRSLVYISAISFGLMHITNYESVGKYWCLAPLLVLPQLIVGFMLPFIRTKAGFIWSFLTHSLYNSILAIYPIGLLLGPGKVNELIKNTQDSQNLITSFSSLERIYVNVLSMISGAVYILVLVTSLRIISHFLKEKRKAIKSAS